MDAVKFRIISNSVQIDIHINKHHIENDSMLSIIYCPLYQNSFVDCFLVWIFTLLTEVWWEKFYLCHSSNLSRPPHSQVPQLPLE